MLINDDRTQQTEWIDTIFVAYIGVLA